MFEERKGSERRCVSPKTCTQGRWFRTREPGPWEDTQNRNLGGMKASDDHTSLLDIYSVAALACVSAFSLFFSPKPMRPQLVLHLLPPQNAPHRIKGSPRDVTLVRDTVNTGATLGTCPASLTTPSVCLVLLHVHHASLGPVSPSNHNSVYYHIFTKYLKEWSELMSTNSPVLLQ